MGLSLFYIIIFPGFLFLGAISLVFEYVDRKLYAQLQNRIGPPWYQPVADIIKLLTKETVVPREADPRLFTLIPVFALASTVAAFLYVPIWGTQSLYPFDSDYPGFLPGRLVLFLPVCGDRRDSCYDPAFCL